MTQRRYQWSADTVFIEIGAKDDFLARWLDNQGHRRYLGVTQSRRRFEQLQVAAPAGAERFARAESSRVVLQNNADVLILSGGSALSLWNYRRVRHARQVAVTLSLNPLLWVALLGWLLRLIAGQYRRPQLVSCRSSAGGRRFLLITDIARVRRCFNSARHFIPHALGVRGFLAELNRLGVRYAVLRWFDALDQLNSSKDVDILFADDDYHRVMALFRSGPGIQPCDAYTASGLPQTEYAGVSYYPPHLANRLLERAVEFGDAGIRIPCPDDHFNSLAYHAVIHKGPKSGLPGAERFRKSHHRVSRDFTPILRRLAAQQGIEVEVTLEGVYRHLERCGWAPPADLVARLAAGCPKNRWLAHLAARQRSAAGEPNLSVFVIRDDADKAGFSEPIVAMIREHGFRILAVKELSPEEIRHGSLRTRGGNWGPGADHNGGGPPARLVIAYDPHPLPLTRRQRKRFPLVTNARQFIKEDIRREINARLPAGKSINALHSSDYAAEAEHFIEVFAPELKPQVAAMLGEPEQAFAVTRPARAA